jgi:ACS family hexuronate transporter-like MFS transporter
MLVCALAVVPVVMAAYVHNLWLAVGLVSLAVAGHQGWSANIFTLVSDMFPQRAVGSVVGIGGFGGAVGGMFIATLAGWVLQVSGSYLPMFFIAGSVYLTALLIIHLLAPRLERAPIDDQAQVDTGVVA